MFEQKSPHPAEPPQHPAATLTGMPGGPGAVEADIHVLDRLHVLYKYRKVMISVALLVLVAGIVQTYTTTKMYRSQAVVKVDQETSPIIALQASQQAAMPDSEYFMQSELTTIQSRDLKLRVVRRLHLDQDQQFQTPLTPQGLNGAFDELKDRATASVQSWMNSILGKSRPAPPIAPLPPAPAPEPTPAQVETEAESRAVDAIDEGLQVDGQQTSHIMLVKFESRFPETAAKIANAVAEEYAVQNLDRRKKKYAEQLKSLTLNLDTYKAKMTLDRKTLIDANEHTGIIDSEIMARQVSQAQSELSTKQSARLALEQKARDMQALDPDKDLDSALTNPEILTATATLRQLRQQYRGKRQEYLTTQGLGTGHPLVKDVDGQIAQVEKDLKNEVQIQVATAKRKYEAALAEEKLAATILAQAQERQTQNSKGAISAEMIKQEINTSQTLYDGLLKQQKETEILDKGITNNVTIEDHATTPLRPFKPDASRNILISLAVGLALGLMLAFGLDYIDDTIKTPEDVTRKLHIPFLGLVPSVRGERQPVLSGPVPHDFGEAYRALRTSLVFTSGGETTRIITVTSAQPLEGKTTTACNLAMVLAFGGSRVLLIDADMRRPGVHKALKMVNTVGLSHLLVGQARVREAIQRTSDPNFCVMTAGRTPPNPSELLQSERMKQLIANLKQGPFDWVVIDTPPVLAVTDAVILTPLVDGVTFVLGAEMTRRRLAERAVHMLMGSRPKVIGAVLNRVNFDRNKYYYSRYYGYQYKSYYGTQPSGTTSAKA